MSNELKVMGGILLATVVFVVAVAVFTGGGNGQSTLGTQKVDEAVLLDSTAQTITPKAAKLTLVEFADFQCPACGAAHPYVKQILSEYKDDIKYVFRHFPLSSHPYGKISGRAVEAAGKQGKFFEMGDVVFVNQKEWSESADPKPFFEKYAKELGLDIEQYKKDIDSEDVLKAVQEGVADGNAVGVNSTPTFFIDGEEFDGGYSNLRSEIDSRLGKLR